MEPYLITNGYKIIINIKDCFMKEGPVRLAEFENEDYNHFLSSIETPIRSDAFAIDDDLKLN